LVVVRRLAPGHFLRRVQPDKTVDYIVVKDPDGTVNAINGRTGLVDFSSRSAREVLLAVYETLPNHKGGEIFLNADYFEVNGTLDFSATKNVKIRGASGIWVGGRHGPVLSNCNIESLVTIQESLILEDIYLFGQSSVKVLNRPLELRGQVIIDRVEGAEPQLQYEWERGSELTWGRVIARWGGGIYVATDHLIVDQLATAYCRNPEYNVMLGVPDGYTSPLTGRVLMAHRNVIHYLHLFAPEVQPNYAVVFGLYESRIGTYYFEGFTPVKAWFRGSGHLLIGYPVDRAPLMDRQTNIVVEFNHVPWQHPNPDLAMDLTNPDMWTETNKGTTMSIWLKLPAGYTVPVGTTIFNLWNYNARPFEAPMLITFLNPPPPGLRILARPHAEPTRLQILVVNDTGAPVTLDSDLHFMLTIL